MYTVFDCKVRLIQTSNIYYFKLCVVNSDTLGTVADVTKSMFVGTGLTFKIF